MMVDMSKVSWLTKVQISRETVDLLNQWAIFTGQDVKPPIPVEAIAERYLEFTLEYDNLDEILGIPDVLGATWAEGKRMVINNSLLDGVEGRITFTCGHEIGHWILHQRYLFDPFTRLRNSGEGNQPTVVCRMSASKLRGERQADYFASCLLMPQEKVEEAYERAFGTTPILIYNEKSCFGRNNPVAIDPALDTAKEIAQRVIVEGKFTNVSKEAMCYRLNDLGLLINMTGKPLVGQFKGLKTSASQCRE
jgi:Zn-dependent peptidase ImmA (M78 family)